jgi:hypothetical protein
MTNSLNFSADDQEAGFKVERRNRFAAAQKEAAEAVICALRSRQKCLERRSLLLRKISGQIESIKQLLAMLI